MKPQFTKGSIYKDGQYYYFKTRDSVNNKQIKKCTFETTIRKAKSASKKRVYPGFPTSLTTENIRFLYY
jgi:hypothetical protein